jgi:hypothetical protein
MNTGCPALESGAPMMSELAALQNAVMNRAATDSCTMIRRVHVQRCPHPMNALLQHSITA